MTFYNYSLLVVVWISVVDNEVDSETISKKFLIYSCRFFSKALLHWCPWKAIKDKHLIRNWSPISQSFICHTECNVCLLLTIQSYLSLCFSKWVFANTLVRPIISWIDLSNGQTWMKSVSFQFLLSLVSVWPYDHHIFEHPECNCLKVHL